jgi:hypothetical protein
MIDTNKLRRIINKYNLANILKVIILLIILYILARIFTPYLAIDMKITPKNIEGFTTMGYPSYGNQISLQDPSNKPSYSGNTATFKLDDMYRIEGITMIFNTNANTNTNGSSQYSSQPIYIQYEDGNGNLRYIKSSSNNISPPSFTTTGTPPTLTKTDTIVDENNQPVYTSKIVVVVGDANNNIDNYLDSSSIGYISKFAMWGSTRDMLSKTDFENLQGNLSSITIPSLSNSFDKNSNTDNYVFKKTDDTLTYGISFTYNTPILNKTVATTATTATTATSTSTSTNTLTEGPFRISITYNNGLYLGNNFNINQTYTIRSDPYRIQPSDNKAYIVFIIPIIANQFTISVPRVNQIDGSNKMVQLNISSLQVYGSGPNSNDIANYKKTVNALLTAAQTNEKLDVCPNVDDLISKQNQAQAICDNLDYQDRIKSEKIRLEKNKQYLIKLQEQQKQIDQLNAVIQSLDGKRNMRAKNMDMARLVQYQQQKGTASTIRDLASQRLQSQANNQLYMDVNINTI